MITNREAALKPGSAIRHSSDSFDSWFVLCGLRLWPRCSRPPFPSLCPPCLRGEFPIRLFRFGTKAVQRTGRPEIDPAVDDGRSCINVLAKIGRVQDLPVTEG